MNAHHQERGTAKTESRKIVEAVYGISKPPELHSGKSLSETIKESISALTRPRVLNSLNPADQDDAMAFTDFELDINVSHFVALCIECMCLELS